MVRVAEVSVNDSLALFCDLNTYGKYLVEKATHLIGDRKKRERREFNISFRDPRMI